MGTKFVPISIKEAEKVIKDIEEIVAQEQLRLEFFQELEFKMVSYMAELEAHPEWYQDTETWLKVCNAYKVAVYFVMLKVSELLERKSA